MAHATHETHAEHDEQRGKRDRKQYLDYADDDSSRRMHFDLRQIKIAEEDRQKRKDENGNLQAPCNDAHHAIHAYEHRVLLRFVVAGVLLVIERAIALRHSVLR